VLGESDGGDGGLNLANVGEGVDVSTLDLPGRQEELALALAAAGVPVVVVLAHGRPLSIPRLAAGVPALLSMWFGGQAQGTALAQVLFGAVAPAGRTPMTWPHDVGTLPCFYNYAPSARRAYVTEPNAPVFGFGHGLTFTTFSYTELVVTPASVSLAANASVSVSVTVTNTGPVGAPEVPQLYVRDDVASVTTPSLTLKGVQRLPPLAPGAAVKVVFTLTPARDLWLIDRAYQRVVEPGTFTLWVGASAADLRVNGTFSVTA
jgi:beta-glucosidase